MKKINLIEFNQILNSGKSIILFDGVCNLCEFSVSFLKKRNLDQNIIFYPFDELESEIYKEIKIEDFNSVIFVVKDKQTTVFRRSDAILKSMFYLYFPWNVIGKLLILIPKIIRDTTYNLIAKNRYRLFGKKTTCNLKFS